MPEAIASDRDSDVYGWWGVLQATDRWHSRAER